MRNARLTFVALAIALAGPVRAGGTGTNSADFLNISSSSRAAGMGEAFTGVADDIGALYYNPSGIALSKDMGVHYVHAFWLESIGYDHISAMAPLGTFGTAGISFTRLFLEADKITLGPSGEPVDAQEKFEASNTAFGLSYAMQVDPTTAVGATLKMISQDLNVSSANSSAWDLGLLYKTPMPQLTTGMAISNIGAKMESSSLPMTLRLGAGYSLPPLRGVAGLVGFKDRWDIPLLVTDINFQLSPPSADFYRLRLGIEYNMALGSGQNLALRTGFKLGDRSPDGLAGLTAGMGYRWMVGRFAVGMDYAYVGYGEMGTTHRFSLTTNFLHLAEASLGSAEERRKREAQREGQAFIQWPPSSDLQVVGYNVYVGESRDGNFAKVNTGPIRGTSLSVKGLKVGKTYFFFVTTVVGVQPAIEGRPFYETTTQAQPVP